MSEFERIVTVTPAYDCLRVQPCVHGSSDCGTRPGASHGRHNAELRMLLRSPVAEVGLVVNTGWELPETPAGVRITRSPSGAYVEFHSSVPSYEGHEPQGSTCDLWPTCYGDLGYTMADEPVRLLVASGSDAVWEWLEAAHSERYSASVLGGAS